MYQHVQVADHVSADGPQRGAADGDERRAHRLPALRDPVTSIGASQGSDLEDPNTLNNSASFTSQIVKEPHAGEVGRGPDLARRSPSATGSCARRRVPRRWRSCEAAHARRSGRAAHQRGRAGPLPAQAVGPARGAAVCSRRGPADDVGVWRGAACRRRAHHRPPFLEGVPRPARRDALGESATITIRARRDEDCAVIEISDGPGVPPEMQGRCRRRRRPRSCPTPARPRLRRSCRLRRCHRPRCRCRAGHHCPTRRRK